ncbi:septum formation family protein [Pseudonocardia sp.]|uniref:septum formation family protein n=1 Tax=Pseudonocardia sp. TaxID=60912 RepID=UPI002617A6C4|nr:septum formation family protein [Pseudonocardia sp.]
MMTGDMDRTLTAPRPVRDDDAPPYESPSPSAGGRLPVTPPGPPMHPVWRIVTGIVIGALAMFGVAAFDTVTGTEVPVLGSFAALPAAPDEPEVVEVQAPPAVPGTCLNWTRPDAADTALVDCAQPHLFEQAGTVTLLDQVELPTDATFRQLVDERCGPVVMTYLNDVFDPYGRYRIGALKPSPSKWEQGDRELRCGLQSASRSGALYPLTGKVADGDQADVQEPGVCLGISGRSVGDPVDCAGTHALETVGIVDLSADFPDAFPSIADQDALLQPRCNELAAQYAGGPTVVADKGLTVYWNNIQEESWAAGTRRANCNVATLLPDRSGFAPVTGSVKGDVVVGDQVAPQTEDTPDAGVPAPPTPTPAAPSEATAPTSPAEPGAPSGEPEAPADGAPALLPPELPVPVGGA